MYPEEILAHFGLSLNQATSEFQALKLQAGQRAQDPDGWPPVTRSEVASTQAANPHRNHMVCCPRPLPVGPPG